MKYFVFINYSFFLIVLLFSVCPPGKYKSSVGDAKCMGCPAHSKAPHAGASECRCDTGYYRAVKDPRSMPCTRKFPYFLFILKQFLVKLIEIFSIHVYLVLI